ncbi:unnamed protein product [Paramecium octaurelia]|uniref:Transmembrane protein n=1 Tax=Paramecium octaurelia TaxID=43137 RepID=A0A8S1YN02_PAROT|nr:unnamed protein product [Paramecium octaurelia]
MKKITFYTFSSSLINDLCLKILFFSLRSSHFDFSIQTTICQTELLISDAKVEKYILISHFYFRIITSHTLPIIGIDRYFNLNISQCERLREINKDSGKISVNSKQKQLQLQGAHNYQSNHVICHILQLIYNRNTFQLQKQEESNAQTGNIYKRIRQQKKLLTSQKQQLSYIPFIQIHIYLVFCLSQYKFVLSFCIRKGNRKYLRIGPRQPFQEIITNEFTRFSLSSSKAISQRYKLMQTFTDEGLIWEQILDQSNIQQSEWREISEFYDNQYLVIQDIMLDYKQTNNIRTYVKWQTILGKLGGIFQILIMIVAIILKQIIENFMKLEIVNNLFNSQNHFKQTQRIISNQINNSQNEIRIIDQGKSNLEIWLIIFGCRQ